MTELLYLIGDWVMLGSILGILAFTVSYAVFFSWRKTAAGRSIMYLAVALNVWAVQSFASRLNPGYTGREWVRLAAYILIFVTVWSLVLTLWGAWNGRREKNDL